MSWLHSTAGSEKNRDLKNNNKSDFLNFILIGFLWFKSICIVQCSSSHWSDYVEDICDAMTLATSTWRLERLQRYWRDSADTSVVLNIQTPAKQATYSWAFKQSPSNAFPDARLHRHTHARLKQYGCHLSWLVTSVALQRYKTYERNILKLSEPVFMCQLAQVVHEASVLDGQRIAKVITHLRSYFFKAQCMWLCLKGWVL